MDKSQSELTDKIRSAIKKKLTEINAFVDDELPEYIMILVANKRSKAHIEKDLSLFLGSDTVDFTNWLWDLLNSLSGSKGNSVSGSKRHEEDSNTKYVDEDADVLDYDPAEQEGDFLCQEDTNESLISHSSARQDQSKSMKVSEAPSKAKDLLPVHLKTKEKVIESLNPVEKKAAKVHPLQPTAIISPYSSVAPIKKRSEVDSTDEYDPTKPDYVGSMPSVVCVTQRKYGGSAALQANKLLLRAVDDATKSVLDGKSLNDYYKPTPIKVLASKQKEETVSSDSHDIFNVTFDGSILKSKVCAKNSKYIDFDDDSNFSSLDIVMDDNFGALQPSCNRTIHLKEANDISSESCFDNMEVISSNDYSVRNDEEEQSSKSPHFIVTLDGVNLKSLKRKRHEICSSEEEEENEIIQEKELTDLIPPKKQKLNERCKFWPACKNSDQCTYHHPTLPCKCFPNCKFGDKCMYIHPNCKFDALCSRKDCPYTHVSKRKLPLAVIPIIRPVKNRSIKTVCKFYPRCTAKKCPFIHPKLCRFGTLCRSPQCPYTHVNVPSRNQMKWQANI
ncbi:zinc finger CCCH domain-containing protein 14-like [Stegodyphus dumicola]|uniref:zinc finger CCCH domain-containing protein 14-like n=1 Tax=Stegodyphus dumicola TaxID=202533 RepID=UPI0015A87F8D|nr:zinc finger CCCH domain-containing protein 14-like [Stegodyphus dumicola]